MIYALLDGKTRIDLDHLKASESVRAAARSAYELASKNLDGPYARCAFPPPPLR
jgi:hypothetical protein